MMNVAIAAAVESKHGDEKYTVKPIYVEHGGLLSSVLRFEEVRGFRAMHEPCVLKSIEQNSFVVYKLLF